MDVTKIIIIQSVSGRKLTVDFYDNKSDVDHTLKVYKEMIKAGEVFYVLF